MQRDLLLDVSVDVRVPEQGLVAVTPEELLGSQVLVFVLSRPLFVGHVSQVVPVLTVLQLNTTDRNGSQNNGWDSHVVGNLGPQLGDTLRVVDLLSVFLLESLTSGLVDLEGIVLDELGHVTVAVAVGVESSKGTVRQISKHCCRCSCW